MAVLDDCMVSYHSRITYECDAPADGVGINPSQTAGKYGPWPAGNDGYLSVKRGCIIRAVTATHDLYIAMNGHYCMQGMCS